MRYEEYTHTGNDEFCLNKDLERTKLIRSKMPNWHENLELQFCTDGEGYLLLDGQKRKFKKGDIAVIGSNRIHYTGTESAMTYSALIISSKLSESICADYQKLKFPPIINSEEIFALFRKINDLPQTQYKSARQSLCVSEMLITLAESFALPDCTPQNGRSNERIRLTIKYIRENYAQKLTLDKISKNVYVDKYFLSHEFKKHTGQTIVEYINTYRCQKAANLIKQGATATQAAHSCGFDNLSFFTKTFKRYIGGLPSELKGE